MTEKIKFVSQVVQILGLETFWLLLLRSSWNFGRIIFEVQTAAGRWVWSLIMCSLGVPVSSSWTVHKTSIYENHKKWDHFYISWFGVCIKPFCFNSMVHEIPIFFNSPTWTDRYSQTTHYKRLNSTSGRGLNLKYQTAKVSWTSEW